MNRRPFLIGLTGNIATGKSQVASILAGLGARIIDADKVAHDVMRPSGPAYPAVVEAFGPEILTPDGTVDRARLGAIVFRDAAALRRLEAIVHPAVLAEVGRQIARARKPVVVVEAIKLIEARMHRGCDELWVVAAPRPVQIARLVATRGLSEEEAALRVDLQPPQEEKAALAHRVIVNDSSVEHLRHQVLTAWDQIPAISERSQAPADPTLRGGVPDSSPTPTGSNTPVPGSVTIRPVRREDLDDAEGVAAVLNSVVLEGRYTALGGHWTAEAELAFMQSFLGQRSELFVAESAGHIVGFQSVEPFVAYTTTMDHVAHLGTYVLVGFRRQGVGRKLAKASFSFAREHGYEKAVIYVLADNLLGLAYYRSLGFEPRGTLTRQTKIGGVYHDEVFMEIHFGQAADSR